MVEPPAIGSCFCHKCLKESKEPTDKEGLCVSCRTPSESSPLIELNFTWMVPHKKTIEQKPWPNETWDHFIERAKKQLETSPPDGSTNLDCLGDFGHEVDDAELRVIAQLNEQWTEVKKEGWINVPK